MIKKIYTFGTSFTHGGGFEWNSLSSDVNEKLETNYGHIDIPKNQFDCSWPGFLQRYLGDDVKVTNFAKSGFGNELIYRKVFDLVTSSDFKKDECLLLLEFSFMMRKEVFIKELDDYIICNYHFRDNNSLCDTHVMGLRYYYDSDETMEVLDKHRQLLWDYMNITMTEDNIIKELNRDMFYILSLLDKLGINYLTTSSPLIPEDLIELTNYSENNKIYYQKDNIVTEYLEDYIRDCKLSISDETEGKYDDWHGGLIGNREVAKQVYNQLINKKLISGKRKKLDFTPLTII